MKIVCFLIVSFVCLINLGAVEPTAPNILAAGTKTESVYLAKLADEDFMSWLLETRPTTINIGQVSACTVSGVALAVSAPHVVITPKWDHPLPDNEFIGKWTASTDGREVAFARLIDSTKFGFKTKLVEAKAPKDQSPATIKTLCIESAGYNSRVFQEEVPGTLEVVSEEKHLKFFRDFFGKTAPNSAIGNRLNVRARNKPLLVMVAPESFRSKAQGSSGAFVWQEGHPVGVFVAAIFLEDRAPLLIMEPLLETAEATIPELK